MAIAEGDLTEESQPIAISHLGECQKCQNNLDELTDAISLEKELRIASNVDSLQSETSEALEQVMHGLTETPPDRPEEEQKADFDIGEILEPDPNSEQTLGRFGNYEVIEQAGRGGMGVVLKARDPSLDRNVAIKLISEPNAELRKRFLLEARSAAALVHENVVTIHAADEHNGRPYIVMQYIDGQSLGELLKKEDALPIEQVIEIARQITAGLAAAHRRGLIHRDIKPENILIEQETGRALLTDFGLVKHLNANDETQSVQNLTQPGYIVGTPRYMAPEQANDKTADARSDLFSLGSVLYAACTGATPFSGDSALQILMQVCEQKPTPVRQINPAISKDFAGIIEKLHEKEPENRFQSADELLTALGQIDREGNRRTQLNQSEYSASKSKRMFWSLAGILALCACLAAVLSFWNPRRAENPQASHPPKQFQLASSKVSFETLQDAINQALPEDQIDISGLVDTVLDQPLIIQDKSLTIRAKNGATFTYSRSAPMLIVDGGCTLEQIRLKHESPGRTRIRGSRNPIDAREEDAAIIVRAGGNLSFVNCEIECASQRDGILNFGDTLTFDKCRLSMPDGVAISWKGVPGAKTQIQDSQIESLAAFAYHPSDGGVELDFRNSSWYERRRIQDRHESKFMRVEQDPAIDHQLTFECHNSFLVGDMVMVIQGKKRSASFLKMNESKNVYSVDGLIRNRVREATTLDQWLSVVGNASTDSVLVDQIATDPMPTKDDIEWGELEEIQVFGAPEKIGIQIQ
jgi:serine/threonine-protein kinase